jgi:hypothetical protein
MILRKTYDLLGSLNLGLWLIGGVILLLGIGSFATGTEEIARLNSMPLFAWLTTAPGTRCWWLWLSLLLLALLALNTVLCTIESLRQKKGRSGLLLRLAPQVMHAGFLLIVLAHLISSVGGFKQVMQVGEWSRIGFPDGAGVRIERLDAEVAVQGYITDFSASVTTSDGRRGVIRPNEPFFWQGVGIYLKQVEIYPVKFGIMEIHREPGAGWAFSGAVLFTLGNIVLVTRRRQDKTVSGNNEQ